MISKTIDRQIDAFQRSVDLGACQFSLTNSLLVMMKSCLSVSLVRNTHCHAAKQLLSTFIADNLFYVAPLYIVKHEDSDSFRKFPAARLLFQHPERWP